MEKLYRIDIYDSASVWAAHLTREYMYFKTEDDAKKYAISRCVKPEWNFIINKVNGFGQ